MNKQSIFNLDFNIMKKNRFVGEAYFAHQHIQTVLGRLDLLKIKSYLKQHHYNTLVQVHALLEIDDTLSKHMPVIHFKGPTLSDLLYNDCTVREGKDIDLLVPKEKTALADQLLKQLGYQCCCPKANITKAQEKYYLKWRKDRVYIHTETKVIVELHHELLKPSALTGADFKNYFNHSQQIIFLGRKITTLSPNYYFLYLCCHGVVSAYARLHWLSDINQYIETSNLDWDMLLTIAKKITSNIFFMLRYYYKKNIIVKMRPTKFIDWRKKISRHNQSFPDQIKSAHILLNQTKVRILLL